MKILHVVHGYPPSMGGAQWLIKNLSEQLVSRHSDRVTVFTTVAYNMEYFWHADQLAMPAGTEESGGVTVRRFAVFNRLSGLRMLAASAAYRLRLPYNDWLRTLYNGPLIWGLARAVANSGAEVVLATSFPLLHMYDALRGARRAGLPIVLLGAIHAADTWGFERQMIYRAIQKADAYIALTAFERAHLLARGIQEDKIVVIGAGIDVAPFLQADGTAARHRYGWGDAPLVILLAKQAARKRFDLLIAAMQKVWDARPDTRLLLAGASTPYSAQIAAMVRALPPDRCERVTVINDLAEEDKPNLLAACDVLVLPSSEESFGIVFLEAWACGKPVIGVRAGAVPAVIDEGHDGLLVACQDVEGLARAILELLSDPQRGAQMGQAGRKKVLQNHTWEVITDRVRQTYAAVLSRHQATLEVSKSQEPWACNSHERRA